jgi:glycosyltransferase involved in cell wall biosynthesis
MKIALFADFDTFGGTRSYFELLLSLELIQQNQTYIFVTRQQAKLVKTLALNPDQFQTVVYSEAPSFLRRFPLQNLYRLLVLFPVLMRLRPDLILCSMGNIWSFLELSLIAKKMIYIMHIYPVAKTRSGVERWVLRRFSTQNRILVFVSDFAKQRLAQLYQIEGLNTRVLKNCVRLKETGISSVVVDEKKFNVLTFGHLGLSKNPHFIVALAEFLRSDEQIQFHWCGDGSLRAELEVASSNFNNIHWHPVVDVSKQFISQFDLYLQPSNYENFSLAVLEAQTSGVPTLVSNRGGNPEAVASLNQVIDIDDVAGTAARIEKLAKTDNELMSKAGREYVDQNFSFSVWKTQFADMISRLMGSN